MSREAWISLGVGFAMSGVYGLWVHPLIAVGLGLVTMLVVAFMFDRMSRPRV